MKSSRLELKFFSVHYSGPLALRPFELGGDEEGGGRDGENLIFFSIYS